jgi:hypothetical protein
VSELRSAIEGLRAETLPGLPDARIEEDFAELHRAGELLEAERLRRLAEIDRRGLFTRDGHLSAASWLATRFRVAWGVAREQVRVARALARMASARAAFEAGDVSMSGVRVLASAHEAEPEALAPKPRWWRPHGSTRSRTSGAWSPTGARASSTSGRSAVRTSSADADGCTPR